MEEKSEYVSGFTLFTLKIIPQEKKVEGKNTKTYSQNSPQHIAALLKNTGEERTAYWPKTFGTDDRIKNKIHVSLREAENAFNDITRMYKENKALGYPVLVEFKETPGQISFISYKLVAFRHLKDFPKPVIMSGNLKQFRPKGDKLEKHGFFGHQPFLPPSPVDTSLLIAKQPVQMEKSSCLIA
jgi:hypothetical protein